jgi:hypothetical protein
MQREIRTHIETSFITRSFQEEMKYPLQQQDIHLKFISVLMKSVQKSAENTNLSQNYINNFADICEKSPNCTGYDGGTGYRFQHKQKQTRKMSEFACSTNLLV